MKTSPQKRYTQGAVLLFVLLSISVLVSTGQFLQTPSPDPLLLRLLVSPVAGMIVAVANVLILLLMGNKYRILQEGASRQYLFLSALFLLSAPWATDFAGSLLALTPLLLAFYALLGAFKQQNAPAPLMTAGFLWGVSALIHPPFTWSVPLIFIFSVSLRAFSLRNLVAALLGFAIPFLLVLPGSHLFFPQWEVPRNFYLRLIYFHAGGFGLEPFPAPATVWGLFVSLLFVAILLSGLFHQQIRHLTSRLYSTLLFGLVLLLLILSLFSGKRIGTESAFVLPVLALLATEELWEARPKVRKYIVISSVVVVLLLALFTRIAGFLPGLGSAPMG